MLRYDLKVGDQTYELGADLVPEQNHGTVRINDTTATVSFHPIGDGKILRLTVNGKPYTVRLDRHNNSKFIFLRGYTYLVEHRPLRKGASAHKGSIEEVPQEVSPPTPSVVVRVMVKEGDRVKKGQGLVVVTAMKMETTLRAPYSGVVKRVNTEAEAKVMPGDILVEIEKEEDTDG